MPFEALLRLHGLEGESRSPDHAGAIDVLSWNWGASRPRESEGAVVHDFSFVKPTDATSPDLFRLCCSGESVESAVFLARRPGRDGGDILRYAFSGVTVVSVRTGAGAEARAEVPLEEITLAFESVTLEYLRTDAEPRRAGWDLGRGTPM